MDVQPVQGLRFFTCGEEVERGKRGNFHNTWEKVSFWKKRGDAKILYFGQIYTPVSPKWLILLT